MSEKHTAWAVQVTYPAYIIRETGKISPKKVFLAGRYYFHYGQGYKTLPSNEGCRIALFNTREEARKAAKGCYYPAKVVRVHVAVERI
jgi:hypothetical protein